MGLKLVDLKLKDTALKAPWPITGRWKDRDAEQLQWFFEHLPIQDERIWECNLKSKDIRNKEHDQLSSRISIIEAWGQNKLQCNIREFRAGK